MLQTGWPSSSPNGSRTAARQLVQQLPRESPLQNVMNFASLEEEIVQTKIRYAMAEKTLRLERQALGRATEDTIDRVKSSGKVLADMYEKRDAIQADRERAEAFRLVTTRPVPSPRQCLVPDDVTFSNRENKNSTQENEKLTPMDNPSTETDTKLGSDPVAGPEEGEIQDDQTIEEAQAADKPRESCNRLADQTAAATLRVRFALTDVETYI